MLVTETSLINSSSSSIISEGFDSDFFSSTANSFLNSDIKLGSSGAALLSWYFFIAEACFCFASCIISLEAVICINRSTSLSVWSAIFLIESA